MEVNLGAIRFNWKGAYAGGTAYVVDDVVSSGGSSYICILASTGNAVSNATYWSQMSQAGTDGTDLTSTLTTQGDVLYRDGSGLQRLAKGTAAQVLSVNSGATAPEWADAAAGGAWTIIQTTEADDVASVTLTGISATYASYCIAVCDVVPASDDKRFYMKTGTSGTIDSGTYDYYLSGSSGTNNISYVYLMAEMGNAAGEGGSGMIWHNRPTTGNGRALFHFSGGSRNKDNNFTYAWGGGQKAVVETVDRVKFQTSGGNITSGRFTLYGIAHA